ncbi:hypothetical protein [Streptomyces sp. MBT62]|uniref:hypothetical protein n=1 Tax=Streptomyces sp. MBT62 TaxID=2800410 RepID=UPI00190E2D0A|nr:hypothetical protein [Streptomyces sp. MBT62]MBK3568539.1 hypothetical protein [Streptomyces sp. MBT62]
MRPDAVLDAAGRALVSIARDEVSVPPRIAALTPTGLLGAMPGYGPAAKLVTVPADPRHADKVLVPHTAALDTAEDPVGVGSVRRRSPADLLRRGRTEPRTFR